MKRRKGRVDCIKVTMESVKNFAWNQMDAMWHDGSGLAIVDMIKFEFNGYWVVNPWMDEKTEKSVNPYEYYGKWRTERFIEEVIEKIRELGDCNISRRK